MKKEELSLRTKEELALSLKILMQKKDFKKITITDLITECNISRPTFYYHFKDIYELMRWAFEYNVLSIVRSSSQNDRWEVGLTIFLENLYENRHFILIVYESLGLTELTKIFSGDVLHIMKIFIGRILDHTIYSEQEIQFLMTFYSNAIVGSILDWLLSPKSTMLSVPELINLFKIAFAKIEK